MKTTTTTPTTPKHLVIFNTAEDLLRALNKVKALRERRMARIAADNTSHLKGN